MAIRWEAVEAARGYHDVRDAGTATEDQAVSVYDFAERRTGEPIANDAEIEAVAAEALAPLARDGGESPYDIQHDLQVTMQTLVGRMRNGPELDEALEELAELKERTTKTSVGGGREFNPGRNPATDLVGAENPIRPADRLFVAWRCRRRRWSGASHRVQPGVVGRETGGDDASCNARRTRQGLLRGDGGRG